MGWVTWHVWFFDKTRRELARHFPLLICSALMGYPAKRRSVSGLPCCSQLKTAKSHLSGLTNQNIYDMIGPD
jgi:hypothetical protein